ncbi:hypothetical protein ACFOW6_16930 [Fodinicurvata halophila]|uniref:Uncharacterized protein n=1 Tax=Fodinicurvata halophila TaxID=1419723 RepID=A0ABV8UQQ7_9PROT
MTSEVKRNCVMATECGKEVWSANREPMAKNRIRDAADGASAKATVPNRKRDIRRQACRSTSLTDFNCFDRPVRPHLTVGVAGGDLSSPPTGRLHSWQTHNKKRRPEGPPFFYTVLMPYLRITYST